MMEFVAANWLWVVLVAATVALHRRGGCSGHVRNHHRNRGADQRAAGATSIGHRGHR